MKKSCSVDVKFAYTPGRRVGTWIDPVRYWHPSWEKIRWSDSLRGPPDCRQWWRGALGNRPPRDRHPGLQVEALEEVTYFWRAHKPRLLDSTKVFFHFSATKGTQRIFWLFALRAAVITRERITTKLAGSDNYRVIWLSRPRSLALWGNRWKVTQSNRLFFITKLHEVTRQEPKVAVTSESRYPLLA